METFSTKKPDHLSATRLSNQPQKTEPKKTRIQNEVFGPVAFRPCLTAGLVLSKLEPQVLSAKLIAGYGKCQHN
jgi:hypothetical protein